MSNIVQFPMRATVAVQNNIALRAQSHLALRARNNIALRGEHGQSTSEYGIVILVAAAFALAVFHIIMSGSFLDGPIKSLLTTVLKTATGLIH